MKRTTIDLLACPVCRSALVYDGPDSSIIETGELKCTECARTYPIFHGIPQFIQVEELIGFNRRMSHEYDLFSWVYRAFSHAAFFLIGMNEEMGRREITDRLDPQGGRVLEVSIGPAVNLPYLVNRQDVGEIFGLDISPGQLTRCRHYIRRKGWPVDLFLGNAEQLPYKDNSFAGVLHIGGINFFSDKKAAIDEMIRVAIPGSKILIGDETEKGAKGYEKVLPGFKKNFGSARQAVTAPVDLVPKEMQDVRLLEVWKGWFYCLEFRKPKIDQKG